MNLARFGRRLKRWTEVIGFKYQCPMCSYPMGAFKPFGKDAKVLTEKQVVGGGRRESAKCHICGCLDRERLIYKYLVQSTSYLENNAKILHFAPETVLSRKIREVASPSNYITADITPGRADKEIDMTDIPYEDETFDLIIANHILEHIPDDKKAMSELLRVLKSNTAIGILQVPISLNNAHTEEDLTLDSDEKRLAAYGQEDHVRIYGQDYPDKLRNAGFQVTVVDWTKSSELNPTKNNKFGFITEEKIFVVSKV